MTCFGKIHTTVNPEYITVLKANDLQEIHGITFFIITIFIFQVVPRYPVTICDRTCEKGPIDV